MISSLVHASADLRFFTHHRKQLFYSDPKEAALEFSMIEKNRFHGKIGNFIHLLSLEKEPIPAFAGMTSSAGMTSFDAGIEAMMFGTFHGDGDWETPLDTIDGRIGGYLELRHRRFQMKASFEHISAHLSDGRFRGSVRDEEKIRYTSDTDENLYVIELDDHFSGYSREFLRFLLSYEILNTRFYAGFLRSVHIPEPFQLRKRLGTSYQSGFETSLRLFHFPFALFLSSDFQWKKEHSPFLEKNVHLGFDLKGFRFFTNYYDGFDQRGIYWDKRNRYIALGLSFPMF